MIFYQLFWNRSMRKVLLSLYLYVHLTSLALSRLRLCIHSKETYLFCCNFKEIRTCTWYYSFIETRFLVCDCKTGRGLLWQP